MTKNPNFSDKISQLRNWAGLIANDKTEPPSTREFAQDVDMILASLQYGPGGRGDGDLLPVGAGPGRGLRDDITPGAPHPPWMN